MRKIVRKDNSYRKKILSISLVIFAFMGIGYSVISSNLLFNGNIELSKYESPYLYDVLKFETLNGGLARKYTGEHHDSFTEEPSKDIYHWYASNDSQGTEVQNKNNVIFAGHCWQMIRTTDTGGVKMMYNGEAENGQCLNTRGNHVGYASRTSQNLASQYWYGTDYTYDSTNKVFSLFGTTEEETWNATTGPNLVGKYTCKSTSENGTCSTLYLVESYNNASNAYVIPLNSDANYSQFGALQFNANFSSPSYAGYMYGDVYVIDRISSTFTQNFTSTQTILSSASLGTSYWYSDTISYDSLTNKYSLVNPYQISSTDEYVNLVGKYTFRNTAQTFTNTYVRYIASVNGSSMYYKELADGSTLSDFNPVIFGNSLTDNGNGTYTLNNTQSVSLSDWYTNYDNYKNKYTCNNSSTTCTNPNYTISTTSTNYTYINAGEKIMIGQTRSGLTLTDTLLVRKDELIINSSNYSDYKYTCNTDNSTCTETTLRMIDSIGTTGYYYAPNHYFGSSVTWDGTNYTLVDTIELENYNNLNNISTHHYMCVSNGLKTCSSVIYIYDYSGSGNMLYITLRDGVTTVGKALENMFTKNITNSTMKIGVDAWYKHYLLEDYDEYIEDTVFCNDRTIRALGGWNPDGGMTSIDLQFKEYYSTSDLSCTNITDKFSVSNNNAHLTYKIGLMSNPEMNLLNNNNARKNGQEYWLNSPYIFSYSTGSPYAANRILDPGGVKRYHNVSRADGVRPAISLKPGTKFAYGTGSMDDPYVVKTANECTYNGSLTQGAEFVDGQYTYRYMQEWNYDSNIDNQNWVNITDDGWGVRLTNLNSVAPVNTRLCTSINSKPIVSMNNMFLGSHSESIDLSSFDTSNVKNMGGMFAGSYAILLDLKGFDTSKVTNMNNMFYSSHATTIDFSRFDTSNVTDMGYMFADNGASSLDLSSFDTKNVTNMSGMFRWSNSTSLNLSSFNTSKVTDMTLMFDSSQATSLDLSSFDNRHNVNTDGMFCTYDINNVITGNNFTINSDMTECGFA